MLSDERIDKIDKLISLHLNEEGAPLKVYLLTMFSTLKLTFHIKGGLAALNARVYAVKANCNRLLDVARETYKENIGDIYQLNRSLSEEHGLPLTLIYQDTGFVFALKKSDLEGELPKGFVNVAMKKARWVFSSMELVCLDRRFRALIERSN